LFFGRFHGNFSKIRAGIFDFSNPFVKRPAAWDLPTSLAERMISGSFIPMHPILLLWDIDGTLISTKGCGREAIRQALLNDFGILDDLGDLEMAGRTDLSIFEDICKRHPGHPMTPQSLSESYLGILPRLLKTSKGGIVHPGVRDILDWTNKHPEVHDALLTGNLKKGAFHKLEHFNLKHYFEFGAFADDSAERNKLGPIVLERARQILERDFHIEYTWVIGDTPKDIACARALGCNVLAVATGDYSVEQLELYEPDLLMPNLGDHREVIQRLKIH
jgi:phosphoglycolate phosphatase